MGYEIIDREGDVLASVVDRHDSDLPYTKFLTLPSYVGCVGDRSANVSRLSGTIATGCMLGSFVFPGLVPCAAVAGDISLASGAAATMAYCVDGQGSKCAYGTVTTGLGAGFRVVGIVIPKIGDDGMRAAAVAYKAAAEAFAYVMDRNLSPHIGGGSDPYSISGPWDLVGW